MKKILSIVLALVLALSLTACGGETLNVGDYLNVEFSGTNGDGNATITGFTDFEEDIMQKGENVGLGELMAIEVGIDYSLDKKTDLTNGDKVTLTIKVDEDIAKKYGVTIKGGTKTFTVSDLPEKQYTKVNPFNDNTIELTGNSPFVTVDINPCDEANRIDGKYEIEYPDLNKQYFKNGDVVKVKFTYDVNEAEEAAIQVISTEKEYVVEGRDVYIQSMDELSKENFDKIYKEAEDLANAAAVDGFWTKEGTHHLIGNLFADSWLPQKFEVKYLGNYFFNAKNPSNSWDPTNNSCFFVFELIYKNDGEKELSEYIKEEYHFYQTIYTKNITVTPDGYLIFDNTMIDKASAYSTKDKLYNDVVIANRDNFTCIENVSFE